MLRRLAERLRGTLQLDDPPWRIALALAVGVFISCTPTFGFQTLIALAVAPLTRLSPAATVAGTWLHIPLVAPFVYAGALKLGQFLLPDLGGLHGFWLWLLVGTTLVGIAAAVVTYCVSFSALSWRRRRALARSLRDTAALEEAVRAAAAVRERRQREPAA